MIQLFSILGQAPQVNGLLDGIESNERFVLMIVALGCATGVLITLATVIGGCWSRIKDRQIEADLKRDMLDRGMTAEEIQKVIEATPQSGVDRLVGSWCKKK